MLLCPMLLALLLQAAALGLGLVIEPSSQVVELHKPAWLHCLVTDGGPSATSQIQYSWQREETSLPAHENHIVYENGTLYIRRVTQDDEGNYTCTAVDQADGQTETTQATLQIAYISLTFTSNPVSQTVLLGDQVTLTCAIDCLPEAQIDWLLNGSIFKEGTTSRGPDGTSILTLSPVLYSHAGVFKCLATNPVNHVYRYSLDATLVIQGQPTFLSSLKPVQVPTGYNATFVCNYHGNPTPVVTWYKHMMDSEGDITSRELQASTKYDVNGGVLHVVRVQYEDEAFYTCTAGNMFGEISESAKLTVTGPARAPTFTTRPQNVTVTMATETRLRCGCSGNPQPDISWKRGEMPLNSTNGTYFIDDTQSTDADWYTCSCENQEGSVNQSVFLEVYTPPVITEPPEPAVVHAGRPLHLDCVAIGNPQPTVAWTTPAHGTHLTLTDSTSAVTVHRNGSLVILSTDLSDTGPYTCTAENVVTMVTANTTVQIEEAPVLTELPVSQGVVQGTSVYLHCRASGVPAPTYTWSRDGEGQITPSQRRWIYVNNTLSIHNILVADEGVYRCVASNRQGQTQAVATLTVTVPPSFTKAPVNQTVNIGENVALNCFSDGIPAPTQWWLKDGAMLQLGDNMVLSTEKAELGIIQFREDQAGIYTCVASNIAATVKADAWISIYDIPEFTVVPEDCSVNATSTLTLRCEGHAIEAPSVAWYRGLEREKTPVIPSDRVTVTDAGHLIIQTVGQSDEDWYTCELSNSVSTVSHAAFVNVLVPPEIFHTNSPQTTSSLSEVILSCQSSGDPSPTIQWLNPSGHLISDSTTYIYSDHALRIVSANESDAGEWTCKACNILGCDLEKIKLHIAGLPTVENITGSISTSGQIILECLVAGQPTPSVTFTSQGQPVTSDTEGHSIDGGQLSIDQGFVEREYTCVAQNFKGSDTLTVTVPSQVGQPTIHEIGSSSVTLSWNEPSDLGGLPLIAYIVQASTDLDSWQDVMTLEHDHDLGDTEEVNVTGLKPHTEYRFRIQAANVLGSGNSGVESAIVSTLGGVPSPPTSVVALEIDEGTILLSWKHADQFNAPIGAIVYKYSVTMIDGDRQEVIRTGEVLANQTLHAEISGLVKPVKYSISVWTYNSVLGLASEPVMLEFDMTTAVIAETQRSDSALSTEKIIAIVFGSVGGVVIVIIVAFVITYIRHQRKTKSVSIVDRTASLDQFYMDTSRSLYEEDSKMAKRKSGISFYSFDESYYSNRSLNKAGKQSPQKGCSVQNDVLLVAKNPLYTEQEQQKFLPEKKTKSRLSRETTGSVGDLLLKGDNSSIGDTIGSPATTSSLGDLGEKTPTSIPNHCDMISSTARPLSLHIVNYTPNKPDTGVNSVVEEVDVGDKHVNEDELGPTAAEKDVQHDDLSNGSQVPAFTSEPSLEQIYTGLQDKSSPPEKRTCIHIAKTPNDKAPSLKSVSTSKMPKPPIRVISPAYLRGPDQINKVLPKLTSRQVFIDDNRNNRQDHPVRDARSLSPSSTATKGSHSKQHLKRKDRVHSLDNLEKQNTPKELLYENGNSDSNGSHNVHRDSLANGLENQNVNSLGCQRVNGKLSDETDINSDQEEHVNLYKISCDNPRSERDNIDDTFLTEEDIIADSKSAPLY